MTSPLPWKRKLLPRKRNLLQRKRRPRQSNRAAWHRTPPSRQLNHLIQFHYPGALSAQSDPAALSASSVRPAARIFGPMIPHPAPTGPTKDGAGSAERGWVSRPENKRLRLQRTEEHTSEL